MKKEQDTLKRFVQIGASLNLSWDDLRIPMEALPEEEIAKIVRWAEEAKEPTRRGMWSEIHHALNNLARR